VSPGATLGAAPVEAAAAPPRAGLVVEFVGIPGAGKSILARRACELLRAAGVPTTLHAHPTVPLPAPSNPVAKAVSYLRYAPPFARLGARHPGALLRAAAAVRATRQRSAMGYFKVLHNLCKTSLLVERCRRQPGVHLVDQGTLQTLWAVAFSARAPGALTPARASGALAALPDVAVVVTAESEDVRRRLAGRLVAIGRLEERMRADPSVLEDAAAAFRAVDALIAAIGRAAPALRVVHVANAGEGDVEGRARLLADRLRAAGVA
jgi:hypothetical protein